VQSFAPPRSDLPEEKLKGLAYVEYEPGKKAVHGADVYQTVANRANFLPGLECGVLSGVQPAVAGDKIFWANADVPAGTSTAFHMNADGSFEVAGMKGIPLGGANHRFPVCAASPDEKHLYFTFGNDMGGGSRQPLIYRRSTVGPEPAQPFIGNFSLKKMSSGRTSVESKPGNDNESLNAPCGLACDAEGRVYVADYANSRIQIFAAEGKYLKTIPADRPRWVCVHQKTGAIYVAHSGRVHGQSVDRISKLISFANPTVEFHADHIPAAVMTLDSWSSKPRLWAAGSSLWVNTGGGEGPGLRIYEEEGKTLKKIADFQETAKWEASDKWFGGFSGTGNVICDPVRETVVYGNRLVVDLNSGAFKGPFRVNGSRYDDIAFDKRGYLHLHWNPTFEFQGVGRVDPAQGVAGGHAPSGTEGIFYPEVPYDYGIEEPKRGWKGIIPTKDQGGAKGFQDGLGVNMRGDVAEQCNIYFVPKMEDIGRSMVDANVEAAKKESGFTCVGSRSYADVMRDFEAMRKRGEEVYAIRRRPGIPLAGATIWVFDYLGELQRECAVVMGDLINGTMIDEDGALYFVNSRPRVLDPKGEKYFLAGNGGTFGAPDDKSNRNPFTGTLVKAKPGQDCFALIRRAPVSLDASDLPQRTADVMSVNFSNVFGKEAGAWIEGAEWLYAGASPIVSTGCSCPTQRLHTDWYKRTFVPEAYRHSFGVLDTAGKLIMHLGRYGNFDDAQKLKPGDADIPISFVRYVSATDNFICFEDWGERFMALKIAYHAEETVPIRMK
jgi:hypothetical protein